MDAAALDVARLDDPLLVVAPHPDDESLACGGLIALLARAGRPVIVLIVSDGAASHPGSCQWPRERLAVIRAEELRAALAVLGVPEAARLQWGLPDGAVPGPGRPGYAELVERSVKLLAHAGVRSLVIPWRRDPHPDHRAVSAVFRAANRTLCAPALLLEYPVWTNLRPLPRAAPQAREVDRFRLDVRAVAEQKSRAIDAHRSQRGLVVDDVARGFSLEGRLRCLFEGPYETYWHARD
jgi:LmbE family N-acetylglucosaminyl deacetylase